MIKNPSKNLTFLLVVLLICSCKRYLETPDGKIPNDNLNHAKEFEGEYQGQFEAFNIMEKEMRTSFEL
jgi:hypothetical protein